MSSRKLLYAFHKLSAVKKKAGRAVLSPPSFLNADLDNVTLEALTKRPEIIVC